MSPFICDGVRDEDRLVNSGAILYHAMSERLNPLLRVVLSVASVKNVGTLEIIHDAGLDTSIVFFVFSKSSR